MPQATSSIRLNQHGTEQSMQRWDAYETDDDAFHRFIAQATGNVLLVSLFDHLNQVRRAVAWRQVVRHTDKPICSHESFAEHDQILEAIVQRDPAAAHDATFKICEYH